MAGCLSEKIAFHKNSRITPLPPKKDSTMKTEVNKKRKQSPMNLKGARFANRGCFGSV